MRTTLGAGFVTYIRIQATASANATYMDAMRVFLIMILPNVQDEPRPWLARLVLLGARDVTAMVVGSGALLGVDWWGEPKTARSRTRRRKPRGPCLGKLPPSN